MRHHLRGPAGPVRDGLPVPHSVDLAALQPRGVRLDGSVSARDRPASRRVARLGISPALPCAARAGKRAPILRRAPLAGSPGGA
jgi:hypothetical protein